MIPDDEDDSGYDDPDDGDEFDELEEAMNECGLLPKHLGGGCTMGGTEHCDFDCQFRDNEALFYGEDGE